MADGEAVTARQITFRLRANRNANFLRQGLGIHVVLPHASLIKISTFERLQVGESSERDEF